MLRKLVFVLSCVSLVLVAAMIVSCGSSNTHLGTMCTGGPFNVVGNWQGTLSGASTEGIINSAGQAVFFDSDSPTSTDPAFGSVAMLPSISGACSFTGTATIYDTQLAGGGQTFSDSIQGSVSSATSITASLTGGGASGNITLSSFKPLTGSVVPLNGTLTGEIASQVPILQLAFTPSTGNNMTFASTNQSSCQATGTFTQEGTSNIFDVSMTFGTGNGCPSQANVSGFGFESNTDIFGLANSAQGTYFYAVSSTSAFVLEIFP